jgi:hypothetical protein
MRKKWNPGCPCCVEEPPGDCDCDTNIRIDIYNADDTAVVFQIGGFGGDPPDWECCSQSASGLSAIEGTYYLDVSGTPDYSDVDYDYYILNTVAANENPFNLQDMECNGLVIGAYYCIWLRAVYRKSKLPDTCAGNVIFQLLKHTQDVFPPSPYDPCDIGEAVIASQPYDPINLSYCMDFTGLPVELITWWEGGASFPCPLFRYWYATYDITNPV